MKKAYEDRSWSFLIASPAMDDLRFEKSVVLVLEENPECTLGVVINKREEVSLEDVSEKFLQYKKMSKLGIFSGGPLDEDKLTIAVWDDLSDTIGNFSFGLAPAKAEKLLSANCNSKGAIFLGHCAWIRGQLDEEIAEGMWYGADVDLQVLNIENNSEGEDVWQMLLMEAKPIY